MGATSDSSSDLSRYDERVEGIDRFQSRTEPGLRNGVDTLERPSDALTRPLRAVRISDGHWGHCKSNRSQRAATAKVTPRVLQTK